jgi:hypothetical protein
MITLLFSSLLLLPPPPPQIIRWQERSWTHQRRDLAGA